MGYIDLIQLLKSIVDLIRSILELKKKSPKRKRKRKRKGNKK